MSANKKRGESLRVLIAHSFYRLSGGEDRCVRQQWDLLQSHHDVSLLAKYNRDLSAGIPTAMRMTYSLRVEREVERVVRSFRPDLIHLHNAYAALGPAVPLVATKLRVPLLLTVHNHRLRCPNGYMFTEDSICNRCEGGAYYNALIHPCFPNKRQALAYASSLWLHRFVLSLERRVSLFVCPSQFMFTRLQHWGIPQEKLRMIRNFTPPISDAPSLPGGHGVYVGRLSREKGVHVLLQALRIAQDPPFKIVGDGPESQRLQRMASRLGLGETEFLGRLPEHAVDGVLRRARFAVIPSLLDENAPLAALEAMARARPLIVSSVGGLRELADDGRGLVVQPGDAEGLARSIATLMADTDVCRTAGAAALAFAQEELTPASHLMRLEQAYREVAAS